MEGHHIDEFREIEDEGIEEIDRETGEAVKPSYLRVGKVRRKVKKKERIMEKITPEEMFKGIIEDRISPFCIEKSEGKCTEEEANVYTMAQAFGEGQQVKVFGRRL